MKKAYLLIYSNDVGARELIKSWANTELMVDTWRYDLPNCFYIIAETSAADLSNSLREFTGAKGRFLVVEVNDNKHGWLPSESWYLMRHKKHKPTKST